MKHRLTLIAVLVAVVVGCRGGESDVVEFEPDQIVRPWIISSYTEGFGSDAARCVESFLFDNYPTDRISEFVFAYDADDPADRALFESVVATCLDGT